MKKKEFAIVGAGLVGSLLSIYLKKQGHKVTIYERRGDMRQAGAAGGRSINLAVSDRGFKALEGVGLADKIKAIGTAMPGRMIHQDNGEQVFQPYGQEGQAIYSVSRGALNIAMMDFAESAGVQLVFDKSCRKIDFASNTIHFADGTSVSPDIIFGADGAFSYVRLSMMLQTPLFDYQQYYLPHGYKELEIPAGPNGAFQIEKNALHIWPRHSFMLIALPNLNGSFTCTLFAPFKGENSFEALQTNEAIEAFFEREFPDAKKLMPELLDDFNNNPTGNLITVKCDPWVKEGKAALIGDAAHAIVPFYGQGMNAGFEDCRILNQIIEQGGDDWTKILEEYAAAREKNGQAIADLATYHFVEMRDKVADEQFLLRKKLAQAMNKKQPDAFMPVYSMVTFSHIPYKDALEAHHKQDAFFKRVFESDINWEAENDTHIQELLTQWSEFK